LSSTQNLSSSSYSSTYDEDNSILSNSPVSHKFTNVDLSLITFTFTSSNSTESASQYSGLFFNVQPLSFSHESSLNAPLVSIYSAFDLSSSPCSYLSTSFIETYV